MSKKIVISDEQALKIRRQWEKEIIPKIEANLLTYVSLRKVFQEISEGRVVKEEVGKPKRDLAEKRRQYFEDWYRKLGFTTITVPTPGVSNREFARRAKLGQQLFFRPATKDVSYEAFMKAVGQGDHWTVTDQTERVKIAWEPTETGYWFWAEVQESCPRLRTCWDNLSKEVNLLCLEEYVIVWHSYEAETGERLDSHTWTWLRTRFGRGTLRADEYSGRVNVSRCGDPGYLAISCGDEGGRAAEVVKNAD